MTKNQQHIISRAITLLKIRYAEDATGHDWQHLERVWTMAKRLGRREKVNEFILEMAALLHDVDDFKFKKEGEEEFAHTMRLLDQLNVSKEETVDILGAIQTVSYKGAHVDTTPTTLEGKIVQDADRLDGLGAIGIARTFAFGGAMGRKMYDQSVKPQLHSSFASYKKSKSAAITHFYEKLLLIKDRLNTPQAKKIAEHRHLFMEEYLKEFFAELGGEK